MTHVLYWTAGQAACAVIYTNLNISDSMGVTALVFTAGCQSVISRRTPAAPTAAAAVEKRVRCISYWPGKVSSVTVT